METYYEKILASLKTEYAQLGLGDGVLESVARQLAASVHDGAQAETAVGGVGPLLKTLQSELDKMRNEKSGLQKKLDEAQKAEAARRKAAEAEKAAEEAHRKDKEEAEKEKPAAEEETPAQLFDRLFQARIAEMSKGYEERISKQQADIKQLTDRLKADDEAREQAAKAADWKARAARLGISPAYDAVVASFIGTSKDADDFETKIKGFKQSLTDDGSRSAMPPETAEQKQEKEGEAIAALIDQGTKLIVEQTKKD